ncbi:MAG: type II toxin-antitoxin system HicA family toxin [Planctomycetota bacterium]
MKRRDLLDHLSDHGCRFLREGGSHTIWENPTERRRTSIPRHREIPALTCRRICRQLNAPPPPARE